MSADLESEKLVFAVAQVSRVTRIVRRFHRDFLDLSWRERYILFSGKLRRFYIGRFRREYVAEQIAARKGSCHRCGACCKLLFRCPFLLEDEGQFTCRIHGNKPENCHIFPINKKDLTDRNTVSPGQRCGFYFE